MFLITICYGIGGVSFLGLISLMVLRQRPTGFGLRLVAVCVLTAIWAFKAAIVPLWMPGVTHLLDGIHSAAWLELLALVFVGASNADKTRANPVYTVIVPIICILSAANDLRFVMGTPSPIFFYPSQIFCRIGVSICGVLIVENLFRNTLPAHRWHTFPLCMAVGALFSYDLFVFADLVVIGHPDAILLCGRGIVLALIVPPLIVAMARNQSWNVDIHVSRRVVFHTATLTAGGLFLIIASGVAGFVGRVPGDWGAILKLTFIGGSLLAVMTIFSVGSLRSRLSRVLSENFFSARYDYREEWARYIATLSSTGDRDPLQTRVVRAIADVVDSPGGVLWLKGKDGNFRVATVVNMSFDASLVESEHGPFVGAFDKGTVVQVFATDAKRNEGVPVWLRESERVSLAVPLVLSEDLVGFVLLAKSRAPLALNWESFDLLIMIGRQSAVWLLEDLSARALAESHALIEYSKKFSFVAHDVKNVSSQLGLMIANMKNFDDQPEFRTDMVRTMEASIKRLNGLIGKLSAGQGVQPQVGKTDAIAVAASLVRELNNPFVIVRTTEPTAICETIAESDLRSVLTHVITNAIEASSHGSPVVISLRAGEKQTIIEVQDKGCGMDSDFIANGLFVPTRSTKEGGHGIGAFQARELVRGAGGVLDVTSAVGKGTLIRIALPSQAAHLEATASKRVSS